MNHKQKALLEAQKNWEKNKNVYIGNKKHE